MNAFLLFAFFLCYVPQLRAGEGLPKDAPNCVKGIKIPLAHFEGKNVPSSEEKSIFLTSEFLEQKQEVEKLITASDGSFSLLLTESIAGKTNNKLDCGDTQKYNILFLDTMGNRKPVNDPQSCGDNLINISPDSHYIILNGIRCLSVKKWEICPLIDSTGYPVILGWSKDGSKMLVREYDNWMGATSADEYIIEFAKE